MGRTHYHIDHIRRPYKTWQPSFFPSPWSPITRRIVSSDGTPQPNSLPYKSCSPATLRFAILTARSRPHAGQPSFQTGRIPHLVERQLELRPITKSPSEMLFPAPLLYRKLLDKNISIALPPLFSPSQSCTLTATVNVQSSHIISPVSDFESLRLLSLLVEERLHDIGPYTISSDNNTLIHH